MDKVVVSDSLREADTTGWGPVRVIKRADAIEIVRALKAEDGKDIYIHGSHVLWNSLYVPVWSMNFTS